MTAPEPIRIAVSGASGLTGRALVQALRARGHRVHPLVRREPRPGGDEIGWDPGGGVDRAALEGVDAVVHLAGAPILARWTEARKRAIRESRLDGTRRLADALARLERPPRVLVSASAIGFYGDRGDEILTEESAPGDDFLAEVCRGWEASADPAREAGIRVVHPRIGIVLSPEGGALRTMLPIFRTGLGGPLGDGRNWMSWIARDDLVEVLTRLVLDTSLVGPVNAVAPHPVRHGDFVQALGRALRRPVVLRAPAFAARCVLGELVDVMLLASQRVIPTRLEEVGHTFRWPHLDDALHALLSPG